MVIRGGLYMYLTAIRAQMSYARDIPRPSSICVICRLLRKTLPAIRFTEIYSTQTEAAEAATCGIPSRWRTGKIISSMLQIVTGMRGTMASDIRISCFWPEVRKKGATAGSSRQTATESDMNTMKIW